jgi:hypothetical protein
MDRRTALARIGVAGAALTTPAVAARAASLDPLPRTKDYVVALVRSHPAIDPKSRPVQAIEPVVMKADPKSAPENMPIFDHFVGDLHLRYVFDDPQFTLFLRGHDMKRLGIDRDELPALVVANFRRLYPELTVAHPDPGLGVLRNGGTLEPCALLDARFWDRQQQTIGKELIAIVPSTDEVIFTSREPIRNIERLKRLAMQRYEAGGKRAVSRTVFAWRNYRWEVLA